MDACGLLMRTLLSDEATQVVFFGIRHSKIPLRGNAADTNPSMQAESSLQQGTPFSLQIVHAVTSAATSTVTLQD